MRWNMKKLIIEGKHELSGRIHIGGAKNSIVALIPATILTRGKCVIENVPDISDVRILIDTLEYLGSKVEFKNEVLTIDNSNVSPKPIKEEFAKKIRASYYFMGSFLGKYNSIDISCPGGCVIGARPIDIHLEAFKKMGVKIEEEDGNYSMTTKGLKGKNIFFNFPSVGATINVMLASVLAKGKTRIVNAATEPEIANIASFLNSMGAQVFGAGTSTIEITGVDALHDGHIKVIPDRIEAGTYLIIGSLLGKNLVIDDIIEEHLYALISKLEDAGVKLKVSDHSIIVNKAKHLKAVNIKTCVYPGFVTDLGQPMSAFLTQCEGESVFEETIYENRLRHVPHLNVMGADIKAFDKTAIIRGKTPLVGKSVKATDLRAGAAMLIAGMVAEGETEVDNIEHLLRGYERIVDKLNNVGANIKLIDE
jgi:UDP-N-acetylglucosamine 1-carboxyvinyltransferase